MSCLRLKNTCLTSCLWGALAITVACGSAADPLVQDVPQDTAPEEIAAQPDIRAVEEVVAEEATRPEETAPAIGAACDDENPCTWGETIHADGTCAGGTAYDCDDQRECTQDLCDGKGNCAFEVAEGHCLVDGLCAAAGDPAPDDPCGICAPEINPVAWAAAEDGQVCDDGDACTEEDFCGQGICSGNIIDCDDDNECTKDECAPANGCTHEPLAGTPCGAQTPCDLAGICSQGECVGSGQTDCDDGNSCTADSCDPVEGCLHAALDGLDCSDGSVCTLKDICVSDICTPDDELLSCEDGNECTADLCHDVSGCYHELNDNPCCDDTGANICDDGNWCTTDSCDPDTGECFHDDNAIICNDYDFCTHDDACVAGLCQGVPVDCDDGNSCTQDSCDSDKGCLHAELNEVPCDDGLECSTGDMCVDGECVADMTGCACQPDFYHTINKIATLAIGPDGNPGSGLDVDHDPTTCSPADKCSQGIDNSLSMLADIAGEALQDALDKGSVILLVEHRGFLADGTPYPVALYIGQAPPDGCPEPPAVCDFLVSLDSFDEDCAPLVALDNATVAGATLAAGGPGHNFFLPLPLSPGVLLEVTLYHTQLEAKITFAAGEPAQLDGILAGAISKKQMIEAVEQVPEEDLPLGKDMILTMLEVMVTPDIDTNNDGAMDAASIGLPFAAVKAAIGGAAP